MTVAPKVGEWLKSPKGVHWKVIEIAELRDPVYTLRSEKGRHRQVFIREIAKWERTPLWITESIERQP